MTDAQAVAQVIVDKFKMDTRHSDYTVIEGDDADQLMLDIAAAIEDARPNVDGSLRKQLMQVIKEFSDYLPEPLEPGDGDELMHILEPMVAAMLEARERAVWEKAARAVENGHFLSNESNEYKWGMQVAAMLRSQGGGG